MGRGCGIEYHQSACVEGGGGVKFIGYNSLLVQLQLWSVCV